MISITTVGSKVTFDIKLWARSSASINRYNSMDDTYLNQLNASPSTFKGYFNEQTKIVSISSFHLASIKLAIHMPTYRSNVFMIFKCYVLKGKIRG